jgi:hypothetical protein
MSNEISIQPGKDETAIVERVVPGRLVYVITTSHSPGRRCGFKLDQLVIRKPDGSLRPYRGEPLSDLGVAKGRKVIVWGVDNSDVQPTLVIDPNRSWDFSATIGSSISTAVNATLGKILR